jgi:S-adenosylmethionine synthetase
VADQISDAVLDAILEDDPNGRVAVETFAITGQIHIAGEVTTTTYIDIPKIVRKTIANIGSTKSAVGFDAETCGVSVSIDLYVTSETAVDGLQHNLVIVAGSAGQIYAFDETTRAVVWHRSFTNAAASIRQQLWTDTSCSDVNPDVGIIGTPVIDRTRDALYVVVATMENGVAYTRLHAIGAGNGNDLARTKARIHGWNPNPAAIDADGLPGVREIDAGRPDGSRPRT